MAEYINREEALMWFKAYLHTGDDSIPTDTVLSDLRYVIPKVDVAPVRHSYWESYDTSACIGTDDEGEPRWVARRFYVCHERKCRYKSVVRSKYCPNCGARMNGDADNG